MFNISDYLKNSTRVLLSGHLQKEVIQRSISDVCNIDISQHNITLTHTTVFITGVSPLARTEIHVHKTEIINCITSRDPSLRVTDLR